MVSPSLMPTTRPVKSSARREVAARASRKRRLVMAYVYRLDRHRPLGLQEFGLSIRLVKASDLPENTCGLSRYDVQSGIGQIDVLRSDEYAKRPGALSMLPISRATSLTR